jgi:hypothetical protein
VPDKVQGFAPRIGTVADQEASSIFSGFPKVFERLCAKLAVVRSVFDIRMAQPKLKSPRVVTSIR